MNPPSKQLHKHSLPLVVLVIGLLFVSMLGIVQFVRAGTTPGDSVTSLLTARLLSIRTSSNGLFRISPYHPMDEASSGSLLPRPASSAVGQISTAGASIGMSVVVDSLGQVQQ